MTQSINPPTKLVILVYGLPGSGKTTLSDEIARQLETLTVARLNADKVRSTLSSDLGFNLEARQEQARRMACLSSIILDGTPVSVVVTDFVNPNLDTANCFMNNMKLPKGNVQTDATRVPDGFVESTHYPVFSVLTSTISKNNSRFADTNALWNPSFANYEINEYLDAEGFRRHARAILDRVSQTYPLQLKAD